MVIHYNTNKAECQIEIEVTTYGKHKIQVLAKDMDLPVVYLDRWKTIDNATALFVFKLPQTPKMLDIIIFNSENGNKKKGEDKTFSVNIESFKCSQLKTKPNLYDSKNPVIVEFLEFIKVFAERFPFLKAGRTLQSKSGRFKIKIVDYVAKQDGAKTLSPAKIDSDGSITISKERCQKYTVAMLIPLLLHEFSHFYLNENDSNEKEADLNAVKISYAMGYPRIEIEKAFLDIFIESSTKDGSGNAGANSSTRNKTYTDRLDSVKQMLDALDD